MKNNTGEKHYISTIQYSSKVNYFGLRQAYWTVPFILDLEKS